MSEWLSRAEIVEVDKMRKRFRANRIGGLRSRLRSVLGAHLSEAPVEMLDELQECVLQFMSETIE